MVRSASVPKDGKELRGFDLKAISCMSESAIVVENLSKRYLIGHRLSEGGTYKYTALRDIIGREVSNFARKAADVVRGRQVLQGDEIEEFWALKDVSFEVKQGEVVGVVGRNGAGKSTLLKILSRITEPTKGRVVLRGRVASLLEVGTGFHPELTGRENIFLNGAILGMTQREVRRKFDEIVAFAEVEKFLDTPVKRYSSGMYVRLAFAVAAHLEPEILIIDEVLAVGDAEFQKKCIGKMNGMSKSEGRTVLFVSHNMSVVQHLCKRAILLKNGNITHDDAPQTIVSHYLSDAVSGNRVNLEGWTDRTGSGEARITELEYDDGHNRSSIFFDGDLRIRMHVRFAKPTTNPVFGVIIHDAAGIPLSDVQSIHDGLHVGTVSGELVVEGYFRNLSLYPGRYLLSPWITDSARQLTIDCPRMCATFDVNPASGEWGDLRLEQEWGKVYFPASMEDKPAVLTQKRVRPIRHLPFGGKVIQTIARTASQGLKVRNP
jgi:lipopolysaccharide transport system ATP-binding protein